MSGGWSPRCEAVVQSAYAPPAHPPRRESKCLNLDEAIRAITEGMRGLDQVNERPEHFTDVALEKARDLAAELGGAFARSASWSDYAEPVSVTERVSANAKQILAEDIYEVVGTVEGRLEAVNVHSRSYFNVYDDLTGQRVEACSVTAASQPTRSDLQSVTAWASRGTLIYRESGRLVRSEG